MSGERSQIRAMNPISSGRATQAMSRTGNSRPAGETRIYGGHDRTLRLGRQSDPTAGQVLRWTHFIAAPGRRWDLPVEIEYHEGWASCCRLGRGHGMGRNVEAAPRRIIAAVLLIIG